MYRLGCKANNRRTVYEHSEHLAVKEIFSELSAWNTAPQPEMYIRFEAMLDVTEAGTEPDSNSPHKDQHWEK
jgi:hypothetical protein